MPPAVEMCGKNYLSTKQNSDHRLTCKAEDTEHYSNNIQKTLKSYTISQSSKARARSLYLARYERERDSERPSTLAENLLRVKTNLERAMDMEPSPRTIMKPDTPIQSIEVDGSTTTYAVTARRRTISAVDDLPVPGTPVETSLAVHSEPTIQEAVVETSEPVPEVLEEEMQKSVNGNKTRTPYLHLSREGTADIVKSKLEALGMFSRDGTPSTSRKSSKVAPAGDRSKLLDDMYLDADLDDEGRSKLKAAGVVFSERTVNVERANEAGSLEVGEEDTFMEDDQEDHNEFLQNKLDAMGIISRQPIPPAVSSSHSDFSTSSTTWLTTKEGETYDIYDEFLQSKLETMGVISSQASPESTPPTSPIDELAFKTTSQAEINFTSPPAIVVGEFESTSQGDKDPLTTRAAPAAAVTPEGANQYLLDNNELIDLTSRQSSMVISVDETTSPCRESSFSTSDYGPVEIRKESIVEIRAAELIYPLSQYDNYKRPLPISKERTVIRKFQELLNYEHNAEHAGHSFVEFDMDEFMIYLPGTNLHHPYEMTGLQNILESGHKEYLLDGILIFEGEDKRYIEGVPFETVSIGSHGDNHQEITVWIQTRANTKSDVYYRLRKPHSAYERFHTGFLWLANLSKNFVDYALDTIEVGKKVSIHNFRRDFYDWCVVEHGQEEPFKKWYAEYNNTDFRTAIAANIDFLANQAIITYHLDGLDVWDEVRCSSKIPFHQPRETQTIVTPFVYECFKEMSFGRFLKKVDPNADTDLRRKSIGEALHLSIDQDVIELDEEDDNDYKKTTARLAKRSLENFKNRPFDKSSIAVGDVLAVTKDSGHISKWKSQKTKWAEVDECWFVYVQSIEKTKRGRAFRIFWMYKPADTSCALMKYPFQDELFLSAHCECEQKENWVTDDQVICRVSIAWGGSHGCKEDFFVRQRFHQHNMSFTTLKESDKKCEHLSFEATPAEVVKRDYEVGSTVLIMLKKSKKRRQQKLEPCEIVSFNEDEEESLTIRRLLRRCEVQPLSKAKLNELVYTDQMLTIPPEQVHHECQVRFYSEQHIAEKDIPPPYSLNGSCDFFYISTRLVENFSLGSGQRFEEIDPVDPPPSLIQGFDPKAPPPKNPMRGLDLFCGGGNMGRGLEDGGAVRFTHACDYQDNAIASYYANTEDTEHTKFFAGSVNDLLKMAMDGNPDNTAGVPLPGDIEFISAGSPCQGFSMMNPLKKNDEALRNQSLVADVASMVEFYRPKYAVLENVVAMAQKGDKRREDCLSQLICCLVGMGYQLQVNLLDAWSFGCPQSRKRLFVVVAAPELVMPKHPHLSHSHPAKANNASLGVMANGLPFGQRVWEETAFKWQSAEEATVDLPDIGDGQTYHCTPFPDHRLPIDMKALLRKQLALVPLYPPGMNAAKAWPNLSQHERDLYSTRNRETGLMQERPPHKLINAFGRVMAKDFFPTITTACAPTERFNGKVAHWSQQRVISILEAKRAQGFLDTDVLVGTTKEQYKIVGNSVARPVAIGQGMALRKAWLQNEDDNPSLDARLIPVTVRDDVAHLHVPSASSSKGLALGYRRGDKDLSNNFETEEDSSVSSGPRRRRESHFAIEVPVRTSIIQFGSSPLPARRDEETIEQSVKYARRPSSPLSALPKTPAWPSAEPAIALAGKEDTPKPDASLRDNGWQDFEDQPRITQGTVDTKQSPKKRCRMICDFIPGESRPASESPAPSITANMSREDASIVQESQKYAHLGRRRSQSTHGRATPVAAQSRLATPASRPPSRMSQKPADKPMSREDISIVQQSQQYSQLGRRRSQSHGRAASALKQPRTGTPASRPSSRGPAGMAQRMVEQSLSRADISIARLGPQMARIGRRRSQTASQHVSRAATPRATPFADRDEEAPRTVKRRKLPNKPILPGSAEKPITFSDSEDDGALPPAPPNTEESVGRQATPVPKGRMKTPRRRMVTTAQRGREETPTSNLNNPILGLDELAAGQKSPTPAPAQSSGWTAIRKPPQPQSVNTIMNQFPLVGAVGVQASPTTSARSRAATPRQRQPRPKKAKKAKQPFAIDLTADSDDESAATCRQGTTSRAVMPYVPMDNSAWMGMMFTKSRNGGLGSVVDECELLGMNMDVEMREVEEVRRLEGGRGGEVVQSVELHEVAQVVHGY